MEKVELRVEGMTCGGCVKSIQNALNGRDGVSDATADLDTGTVSIDFDPNLIQQAALEKAIVDAGFEVTA
jgi:copper chaperone